MASLTNELVMRDTRDAVQDYVELARRGRSLPVRVQCDVLFDNRLEQRVGRPAASPGDEFYVGVIVEHDAADPIARVEDTKRRNGGSLGRGHRFHVELRAEEHRHALVHNQQRRPISLFGKDAHMGATGARRRLPVD